MNKFVLAIGCCFLIAILATHSFDSPSQDAIKTAAISPQIANSSKSIEHGREWYVSAESLANYNRKVILKFPSSLKF